MNKQELEEVIRNSYSMVNVAKKCGIGRSTLYRLCKKWNIDHKKLLKTTKNAIEQEKEDLIEKAEKRELRSELRKIAHTKIIADAITSGVKSLKYRKITPTSYSPRHKTGEEAMVAPISDVHCGRTTPDYNIDISLQRLDNHVKAILDITEIQRESYKIDNLFIPMLGDIVDGDSIFPGHEFKVETPAVKQVFRFGQALGNHIAKLTGIFSKIEIAAVMGNHGRMKKWTAKENNWDYILYEFLRVYLKDYPQIKFHIPEHGEKMIIHRVYDHGFLLTHGDLFRMYYNIPWYNMTEKGMRWSQSIEEKWEYMLIGHFHTPNLGFQWNNIEILSNGAYLSSDDYTIERIGMSSKPYQICFGVHKKRGVSFRYKLSLD